MEYALNAFIRRFKVRFAIKILSAAVVGTAFLSPGVGATSCDGAITLTGPESTNIINCKDVSDIVVKCTNNIIVGTVNTQNSTSGNGSINNNTNGGNVATGTVVNDNGQNVTIGATCGEVATTTGGGAVTPPVTPGSGAISPAETPAGGLGSITPETLPNTSSPISPTAMLAGAFAATTGAFGISRLITSVYSRIKR